MVNGHHRVFGRRGRDVILEFAESAKPSFDVSVQVGTPAWKKNDFRWRVLLQECPHWHAAVVAINDQVTGVLQEAVLRVGQVKTDLLHPCGLR